MEISNSFKLKNKKYPLVFLYENTAEGIRFYARDMGAMKETTIEVTNKTIEKLGKIESCFDFFNFAIDAFNKDAEAEDNLK